MKFEDVFLTEKQTILGPDRDVGSIPITRSIFILAHKNSVNQWFWVWELINLTTKTYNISIVVHGSQIRQLSRDSRDIRLYVFNDLLKYPLSRWGAVRQLQRSIDQCNDIRVRQGLLARVNVAVDYFPHFRFVSVDEFLAGP